MESINGKVSIPGDYFLKMAKADYRNYQQALWREIYQNSIDAKATEIHVSWNEDDRSITILDNGCGMSLGTLQNKLLALGGSEKATGSVGAFGKAKELELFSWKEYMLHTRDLLLMGNGDNYNISSTDDIVDGTEITIYVQEDENFRYITGHAAGIAKKMETNCKIFVDNEQICCTYPKGNFRKSLECGDVYVNENLNTNHYAQVRIGGIWMFEHYIGVECPHVTLELSGSSIAALTSNRDGMKDSTLSEASQFFKKMATDRKSALFPDKEMVMFRAKGTDGEKIEVSDEDMAFIESWIQNDSQLDFVSALAKLMDTKFDGEFDKKLMAMRAVVIDRYDYHQLRYFGFRWDTVHKFEKGQEKTAKNFLDGTAQNAKRAKTLLTLWGEILKQTMIDTKKFLSLSIGLNWDKNQQAQFCKNEIGEITFFLNPNILDKYPLTNKAGLVKKLGLLAAHEIAHIDNSYHDEYFMMECERCIEASWKSERIYDRIAKIK